MSLVLTKKGYFGPLEDKTVTIENKGATLIVPTEVLNLFLKELDQNDFKLVPGEGMVGMFRSYLRVQLQADGDHKKLEALFDSFCEKHKVTRTAEV